jgi:uncharacterized membrane protein
MDDNYDMYKTANIEINQLFFERLIDYLILRTYLSLLVKYISLTSLHSTRSPISTFAPVKSFVHVSVKIDDEMYN